MSIYANLNAFDLSEEEKERLQDVQFKLINLNDDNLHVYANIERILPNLNKRLINGKLEEGAIDVTTTLVDMMKGNKILMDTSFYIDATEVNDETIYVPYFIKLQTFYDKFHYVRVVLSEDTPLLIKENEIYLMSGRFIMINSILYVYTPMDPIYLKIQD